jgi:thymidine phosphorylase
MNPALIIAKKRDGLALSADEIAHFVHAYARGEVPRECFTGGRP